ncbi:MAG: hypothetical protein IJZ19_10420 [Lentisphaeria bacterium]|nr:hypothetical protein [Lentisphaeria bacterium]
MFELIYTSAPRGLIAGRSGFSTVAVTDGFPPNLISAIENMSGYKTLFQPGDPNEKSNPVNYSCQHYFSGSTRYTVLSKIAFAGLSYTGRTNILAHHLIFTREEFGVLPHGAAPILYAASNFPPWEGEPRLLAQKQLHDLHYEDPAGRSGAWARWSNGPLCAEWAAARFRRAPGKSVILAFDPLKLSGEDILELVRGITALMTPEECREFTFSTYCCTPAIANPPALCAYPLDSPLLNRIRLREPDAVIDLSKTSPLPPGAMEFLAAEKNTPVPARPSAAAVAERPAAERKNTKPSAAVPPPAAQTPPPPQNSPKSSLSGKEWLRVVIRLLIFGVILFPILWWIGEVKQKNETVVLIPLEDSEAVSDTVPSETVEPSGTAEQKTQFGNLSAADEIYLHCAFRQKERFPLPEALKGATSLEVIPDSIGEFKPASLKEYVTGNGTNHVTIFPVKELEKDFGSEIAPDRESKQQMVMRLHFDTIDFQKPRRSLREPHSSRLHPDLKNIRCIRFHGPEGKVYSFEPQTIRDSYVEFFNRKPGFAMVRFEKNIFYFTFSVSNELWAMREYFELQQDGRSLGDINERRILLKQVDCMSADILMRKRNRALAAHQKAEKSRSIFLSRAFVPKPVIDMKTEKKYGKKLERLKRAMEDSRADLSFYISELPGGKEDKELQRVKFQWKNRQYFLRNLKSYDQHVEQCLREYRTLNNELRKHLQEIYPALFHIFEHELKTGKEIFFSEHSLQLDVLEKQIDLKVIKRRRNETR